LFAEIAGLHLFQWKRGFEPQRQPILDDHTRAKAGRGDVVRRDNAAVLPNLGRVVKGIQLGVIDLDVRTVDMLAVDALQIPPYLGVAADADIAGDRRRVVAAPDLGAPETDLLADIERVETVLAGAGKSETQRPVKLLDAAHHGAELGEIGHRAQMRHVRRAGMRGAEYRQALGQV